VYKKATEKEGFNPVTPEIVVVERSAVTSEGDLPSSQARKAGNF